MSITAWPTHTPSRGPLTSKLALQGCSRLLQDGHLTKARSDVISSATCALWDLAEQSCSRQLPFQPSESGH